MNIVLIIAWVLALISAIVVPPDSAYLSYIDFHTLGLLFCLMAVMAGANRLGVFRQAADRLLTKVKNSHQLELILVFLCFISSMLITNDVALITFVPFAIQVLEMSDRRESIVRVVVLQTIAANLGSMFTPIGNPQNLYLYSRSGMGGGRISCIDASVYHSCGGVTFRDHCHSKKTAVTHVTDCFGGIFQEIWEAGNLCSFVCVMSALCGADIACMVCHYCDSFCCVFRRQEYIKGN